MELHNSNQSIINDKPPLPLAIYIYFLPTILIIAMSAFAKVLEVPNAWNWQNPRLPIANICYVGQTTLKGGVLPHPTLYICKKKQKTAATRIHIGIKYLKLKTPVKTIRVSAPGYWQCGINYKCTRNYFLHGEWFPQVLTRYILMSRQNGRSCCNQHSINFLENLFYFV